MIDLHIHSTASDDSFTPSEILDLANQLQLSAIAITDHDSLEGVKEALTRVRPPGLRFLNGIEISAAPPACFAISGSFHLLGYGIRTSDPALNSAIERLQRARRNRNPHIIQKLDRLGIQLNSKEMGPPVPGRQLGRPHIARQMVKQGYVETIDEAFDRYLGTGKPAYVSKQRIPCETAIELIREAGGIPVMAHPFLYETADQVICIVGNQGNAVRICATPKERLLGYRWPQAS